MSYNNFYHELDLDNVLQCPVCYELPLNEIFLCRVGHHMCEKCRRRLPSCPTCQSPLTGCRNFLAETFISKIAMFSIKDESESSDNNNRSDGDTPHSPSSVSSEEQIQENTSPLKALPLPGGKYTCPLESCRNRSGLPAGDIFSHIENVHTHLYDKFKNTTATFNHCFESFCFMKQKRFYHRAFSVSNMGMFYLNFNVLPGEYINCWLSMPAPVSRCNHFKYEIQFSKEDSDMKKTFIDKLPSNLQTKEWLSERGRVFVIPSTSHKLGIGHFFSLSCKIVYNKEFQREP